MRMKSSAVSSENHSPRSTSGITILCPERGGHSISHVLLTSSAGSQSPSKAHARTTLPLFCCIDPSSKRDSEASNPVSS